MVIDSFFSYFIVGGYMKITFADFFSMSKPGILIDIRDTDSFHNGHVPGALNIRSSDLLYHTSNYLNHEDTYYLYCDVGYISDDLCRRLRLRGYHVISIVGGYQNYLLR